MKDLTNENIIHIKHKTIEYIQFKKLLEYSNFLEHCYTLKTNGLDFRKYEDSTILEKNYKKLCEDFKFEYKNIIRPFQTHSDNIISIKGNDKINLNEVDGLITNQKNKILSLTYADCIPIYMLDSNKKVISNIHSGWKGTVQKISKKAVEKMILDFGCNVKDIICCIGPSICKKHFEVDADVMLQFKNVFSYTKRIEEIIESKKNIQGIQKYYIDTVLINRIILEEIGVKPENIIESKICTVCNNSEFHSYRHSKELAGRNTALIYLK